MSTGIIVDEDLIDEGLKEIIPHGYECIGFRNPLEGELFLRDGEITKALFDLKMRFSLILREKGTIVIERVGTYLNELGQKVVILKRNYQKTGWIGLWEMTLTCEIYSATGECVSGETPALIRRYSDAIAI